MDTQFWIEIFGTTAGVIVAISLTMKNIKRLRIINAVGAAFFAGYGAVIGAWPVAGLNLFIMGIDIYYLVQMLKHRDQFDVLAVDMNAPEYLQLFLSHWESDIASFTPGFSAQVLSDDCVAHFIIRDTVPVSLVIYRPQGPGDYQIVLDYATPAWRDRKNARFFLDWAATHLAPDADGRRSFVATSTMPRHVAYLESLGFVSDGKGEYRKVL